MKINSRNLFRLSLAIALAGILYCILSIYCGGLGAAINKLLGHDVPASSQGIMGLIQGFAAQDNYFVLFLERLLNPVQLRFPMVDFQLNYYLLLCFYLIFLLGAILYKSCNGSEIRLLRFCFSVIFIQSLIAIPFSSITLVIAAVSQFNFSYLLIHLFGLGLYVFWFIAARKILRYFSAQQELSIESIDQQQARPILFEASKWTRFFHLIFDTLICFSVTVPVIAQLSGGFFSGIADRLSENLAIEFLFIVCRLLYYPFCEAMLGATPAKLLSQTRVVNEFGEKISGWQAIGRTCVRFVPFEPFSFFVYGWHDKWTNTQVVKEKKPLFHGAWFFILIPVFVCLYWLMSHQAETQQFEKYKTEQSEKFKLDSKAYMHSIDALEAGDLILIQPNEYDEDNSRLCLKVNRMQADSLYCSGIWVKPVNYAFQLFDMNVQFSETPDSLLALSITLTKTQLKNAYPLNADDGNYKLLDLKISEKFFAIEKIYPANGVVLSSDKNFGVSLDLMNILIYNQGESCTLKKLTVLEGDISWKTTVPQKLSADGRDGEMTFVVEAAEYKAADFKFELELQAASGKNYFYTVEGNTEMVHLIIYRTEK